MLAPIFHSLPFLPLFCCSSFSSLFSSEIMSSTPSVAASAARSWQRVEFEGANNSLQVLFLHVGQRIRVELEPEVASPGGSPLTVGTDEELARTAKATVRYIGPVAAARDPTAVMLGIEWDEGVLRGRNDGSVGGKRYFTCSAAAGPAGTKAGSFIQPSRVWRAATEAQNMLRAIENKSITSPAAHAGTRNIPAQLLI